MLRNLGNKLSTHENETRNYNIDGSNLWLGNRIL